MPEGFRFILFILNLAFFIYLPFFWLKCFLREPFTLKNYHQLKHIEAVIISSWALQMLIWSKCVFIEKKFQNFSVLKSFFVTTTLFVSGNDLLELEFECKRFYLRRWLFKVAHHFKKFISDTTLRLIAQIFIGFSIAIKRFTVP